MAAKAVMVMMKAFMMNQEVNREAIFLADNGPQGWWVETREVLDPEMEPSVDRQHEAAFVAVAKKTKRA